MATSYNQTGYVYNQVNAIYNQAAIERTATGSGQGTETATQNFFTTLTTTATGDGLGTSNNSIVVGLLRTAFGAGGATTSDTAEWNIYLDIWSCHSLCLPVSVHGDSSTSHRAATWGNSEGSI